MDNYNVIFLSLPITVKGFSLYDAADDYYTIVINNKFSHHKEIFEHELLHIKNGDFRRCGNVATLEKAAHGG